MACVETPFCFLLEEEEQMKNHTLSMLQEDLAQFSEEELSRDASCLEKTCLMGYHQALT